MAQKEIKTLTLKACELNRDFGNPRKVTKKKLEELKQSFDLFGDFGVFIIDENYSIIGGNMRHQIIMDIDPTTEVLCKMLIGYTEAEKKAINIKDNTHAGEWDLDLLAEWTADLAVDLGLDINESNPEDRRIENMDPIRYEKYDFVLIVCKSEIDYNELVRNLGIEGKKVEVTKKRRIKARAIWYHDMKSQIVPKG